MFNTLITDDNTQLAYHHADGAQPGVMFLGGFKSDMTGSKATALEAHCMQHDVAFTRFDYLGHGASSGNFTDGTIGQWAQNAIAILDDITAGPQILVGSSMGGWLMLLAALARPQRVAGLIGIAAAPDFTERLLWAQMNEQQRHELMEEGVYYAPSCYGEDCYPITRKLIEEGRNHLLLESDIAIHCPIRLIHGMSDPDVPWQLSTQLAEKLMSDDVDVQLIKSGDHRMSQPENLSLLCDTLDALRRKL